MSNRVSRCTSRLILMAIALVLAMGPMGCSRAPKKHWWQFWRKGPAKTSSVYGPDTVIPPPPESLGAGGSKSAIGDELPPGPSVKGMEEPDPLRRAAAGQRSELRTVYFDYDSAELTGEAQSTLDGNAAWLVANPNLQIQIEGHCDERGTVEYNLNLGDRRAKAVKEYLVSKGVDAERLHTISYGEERPEVPGNSESAWAKNRRAQFLVY